MSDQKIDKKETAQNEKENHAAFIKSTEQTVCSPEFPAGCVDVEMDEAGE